MVSYSVVFWIAGLSICVGYALAYAYLRTSARGTFLADTDLPWRAKRGTEPGTGKG